jgi:hypothetical protein
VGQHGKEREGWDSNERERWQWLQEGEGECVADEREWQMRESGRRERVADERGGGGDAAWRGEGGGGNAAERGGGGRRGRGNPLQLALGCGQQR